MKSIIGLIKTEPTVFLFSRLWRFSAGNRGVLILYLLFFVFANLASLLPPLIFAKFLNEIQFNGIVESNITYLLFILSWLLGATLLFWVFHGPGRVMERTNAFRTRVNYREYLLRGVLDLGLSWHGARDSGDTIDKIEKASNSLYQFSQRSFIVMEVVIRIVGTSVVLYFFNPYIGLAVVPFIVFSFFILFQFDKRLVKQYKNLNLLDNKIAARVFDALSNVTSIIILNVSSSIMRNVKRVMLTPTDLYKKNSLLNEKKWFVGSMFFDMLVVVPMAFYILYSFNNNIVVEIGTISALFLYLTRLSEVFFSFGNFYENMIRYKTSIQNAAEIEDAFIDSVAHKKPTPAWKEIEVKNVSFTYEGSDHTTQHLSDVSLKIKKGERIAMIGESGSGKTTFLKVLHGLYQNVEANICFDKGKVYGTNFFDLNLHTMLVPQEPELFSASIRENITFGIDYPKEEIEEAISLAQFRDVVDKLPNGLKSAINEKGVNLSGGQKQRLALARALLFSKNKEVILLDESTSSVDPKNEARIYENISEAFSGKTILASIHKMNLLRYFDRIVIFEAGEIVDDGSFEELIARNEQFKKDWESYVDQNKPEITKN